MSFQISQDARPTPALVAAPALKRAIISFASVMVDIQALPAAKASLDVSADFIDLETDLQRTSCEFRTPIG